MPYRRLPNTDQARIRALKTAVEQSELACSQLPPLSLKLLGEARNFLVKFDAAQRYYAECYDRQAKAGRKHQINVKQVRLYVSHFIQVLDMSVIRQEIKSKYKAYYGLDCQNHTLPDLSSETALMEWGKRIIEGEGRRTSEGGMPIYNPSIVKVRVHYDIFADSFEQQKNLQSITGKSLQAVTAMRAEADRLILEMWNQIEKTFESVTPNERRLDACRDYGVVYYYRSGEGKV